MKYLQKSKKEKTFPLLGIVGLSHLGIVWSAAFAIKGFHIVGFDIDSETVDNLNKGIVTIPEPGIQEIFDRHRDQLFFSTDPNCIKDCSIVIFAKDMPYNEAGVIDEKIINNLLKKIFPTLSNDTEFIFMCQVHVGFTRKIFHKINKYHFNRNISLTYCLQTLTIGTTMEWFNNPDRIVFGLANIQRKPSKRLINTYKHFNCPLEFVSYESAELTKAAISLSLACSVTFINTISDICEKLGADINDIVKVMKLDKRFSPLGYWRPGLGFAGGHLERDLNTLKELSKKNDLEPELIKTIIDNSKNRYNWLVDIIENNILNKNAKPRICIWGLAYKKGTDSLHNAHCLRVIRDFSARAELTAFDPWAVLPNNYKKVKQFQNKIEALRNADCVIILTEWEEFSINQPNTFDVMRKKIIIDCVNIIGPKIRTYQDINYFGMGIPHHSISTNRK